MQLLYGQKGLLIEGAIDPETNLEQILGTCPEYLEKQFKNGIAEITNPDEKDPYAISIDFDPYSSPVNANISIVAKTGKRAIRIADLLEKKLDMKRLECPVTNSNACIARPQGRSSASSGGVCVPGES